MAYTGTGTQTDPYILSTWEDFKAVCNTKNAYIAFAPDAENKVIDINETEDRGGLSKNLTINAFVEGNGWEIRNLATNSYYIQVNSDAVQREMRNLHFRNLVGQRDRIFNGAAFFVGCSFSGLLLSSCCFIRTSSSYGAYMTDCTFHLQFWGEADYPVFAHMKMTNCHIHLVGRAPERLLMTSSTNYLVNCKLTGSLKLEDSTFDLCGGSNDSNVVIALELTGTGSVTTASKAATVCIIDTDLIADTLTVNISADNRIGLTTAQMQDPVYLLETVGFPCTNVTA